MSVDHWSYSLTLDSEEDFDRFYAELSERQTRLDPDASNVLPTLRARLAGAAHPSHPNEPAFSLSSAATYLAMAARVHAVEDRLKHHPRATFVTCQSGRAEIRAVGGIEAFFERVYVDTWPDIFISNKAPQKTVSSSFLPQIRALYPTDCIFHALGKAAACATLQISATSAVRLGRGSTGRIVLVGAHPGWLLQKRGYALVAEVLEIQRKRTPMVQGILEQQSGTMATKYAYIEESLQASLEEEAKQIGATKTGRTAVERPRDFETFSHIGEYSDSDTVVSGALKWRDAARIARLRSAESENQLLDMVKLRIRCRCDKRCKDLPLDHRARLDRDHVDLWNSNKGPFYALWVLSCPLSKQTTWQYDVLDIPEGVGLKKGGSVPTKRQSYYQGPNPSVEWVEAERRAALKKGGAAGWE